MVKVLSAVMLSIVIGCVKSNDAAGLYAEGVKAFNGKNMDKAEELFSSAISRDKKLLNAYLMIGKIRYYRNDYAGALQMINKILNNDYGHVGALYWKARILVMSDNQDIDEQIELLKKVLEYDNSHIHARLLLSLLYEKKGETGEAMHEYNTILSEEENIVIARGNLAILYMRLGMAEKAKSEIDKAVKISELTGYGIKNIKIIKSEFDKWEKK